MKIKNYIVCKGIGSTIRDHYVWVHDVQEISDSKQYAYTKLKSTYPLPTNLSETNSIYNFTINVRNTNRHEDVYTYYAIVYDGVTQSNSKQYKIIIMNSNNSDKIMTKDIRHEDIKSSVGFTDLLFRYVINLYLDTKQGYA